MKNTIRVRRNGGKAAVSSQSKTSHLKTKRYCLSLMEWTEGGPDQPIVMGEIDLPALDFKDLEQAANNSGDVSFSKLLKIGYRAMKKGYPFCEDENAMLQANALSTLLFQTIEYERLHDGNFGGRTNCGESLAAGLQQLAWQTQERLTDAIYSEY